MQSTEVSWLDGEGNLLSAGPPETVRGPDDLYTVSSRVTVEKRHSNRFTCRVQQKNINQTREAHIHVPDDFFKVESRSSYIIIGLTVSLAVSILLILFFFVKWRQNKKKTKRSHMDETDTGEKRKNYESEEEREREHLTTDETVQMKALKAKGKKKSKHQLQEEQQRRKEAETLKKEVHLHF
ncbi:hypothetical protein L3Q82_016531 [Scortum barcoo]|uniref:Uncharacterized protein n=1 Tax=Scortum barcoo TaxID=214431 RepID=A0ACB8X6Q0_9TELE|nr:hypothetical protein L3Q82_016531 [Scortum barcoo]